MTAASLIFAITAVELKMNNFLTNYNYWKQSAYMYSSPRTSQIFLRTGKVF